MAHFANLNENNVVTQVIVVSNEALCNVGFPESEPIGIEFCRSLYGHNTNWAQTSYNANFRFNYASVGYTFDKTALPNGAFIAPQSYASWVLNATTYRWEPPVPYPDDGKVYDWDEAALAWVEIVEAGTLQMPAGFQDIEPELPALEEPQS